jgi:DnaA-homolog protein
MRGAGAQLPLGIGLRDSSVFASYFAGRNQPVVDTLLAMRSGAGPGCVWLLGGIGAGKSHLLQAVCASAGERGEAAAYLPLAQTAQLGAELLSGCGELAWVCVDDVESIAGRPDWDRAMFQLYRELEEHRGRLLIASASPPAALPFELPDLASRLKSALLLALQPLDEDEQIGALRLRAQLRGFDLPHETGQYMLRRLPRNMATLCSWLDALDAASLAAQRRLTVPFVREVIGRQT